MQLIFSGKSLNLLGIGEVIGLILLAIIFFPIGIGLLKGINLARILVIIILIISTIRSLVLIFLGKYTTSLFSETVGILLISYLLVDKNVLKFFKTKPFPFTRKVKNLLEFLVKYWNFILAFAFIAEILIKLLVVFLSG